MSSNDVQMLVEMGFSKEKAEKALAMTSHQGVEPAMEWLLAHGNEFESESPAQSDVTLNLKPELASDQTPDGSTSVTSSNETPSTDSNNSTAAAKSLKCDECGKLFKNQLEVEYHAVKSGHSQFSESTEEKKPLTEEEKKEQLRLVEEKLKQKRLERQDKEKVEALEREKCRIKSGKELVAAKKKFEEQEMKKILDQRKREKEEERVARERVRAQIDADRAARKAKQEGLLETKTTATSPVKADQIQSIPVKTPSQPKTDYSSTRIQVRLTNGEVLTQTFNSKEQLSAVRLYIEMNRSDGDGPFSILTNFPKKVFQEEDYEKPLDILGLVPSAVIIVSKTVN